MAGTDLTDLQLFAADRAKAGTILRAKQTVWKFKIDRFTQRLVHIKHAALDNKVILLILKLGKLLFARRSLGDQRAHKADVQHPLNRVETARALAAVRNVSR